jgi:dipeptide/tripeptide permease
MIQLLIGLFMIAVYPFVSKIIAHIILGITILASVITFLVLSDNDIVNVIIVNSILIMVGLITRQFIQKVKYESESRKMTKEYEDNNNELSN